MAAAGVEHTFTCNLCESLCGMRVTVDGEKITSLRGDPDDVISHGHVCPKAVGLRELYDDPDRLRTPRIRDGKTWREASWEEALEYAATELRKIRDRYGADAIALYVGNPNVHSHRGSFASQLLTAAIGSKNRFDPNSQDSNPRLFACMQMYGDALTLPVPDVERLDYFLILGANPAASNGSQMGLGDPKKRFQEIRERGGKIVLIDPRRTESMAWATSHHFIRPDGDAPLLLSILHVIFSEKRVQNASITNIAAELPKLREIASRFSPERVAPAIGIDAGTIRSIARDFVSSPRAVAYSRVGVCQSAFGPLAAWLTEALNVVTGNFDREGGVMFPTPTADVGPLGRLLVGNHWGRWKSRVRGLPEFLGALPSAVMAEEIETPGKGQIRAMVCIAGNPILSTPNGPRLDRAMSKLDFVVSIDLYANETARHAHVLLPPKHIFETGNFDLILARFAVRNIAKYSPPIIDRGDDAPDDWNIATELALRLKFPNSKRLQSLGRSMAKNLPERMIDLLLRTGPYRLSLQKLKDAPHGIDLGPLMPTNGKRIFTKDGRVNLVPDPFAADLPRLERWVDDAGTHDLVLIGRRHLRSNNSWMHNLRVLTKGADRTQLMMNPKDAERLHLVDGVQVRVKSRVGEVTAKLAVTDDVMPGVVSLPHGFGHADVAETMRIAGALGGPNANAITDEARVEPIIGTSILNGVPVEVEAV